jgi:predicted nuclease with TOPRIM domain
MKEQLATRLQNLKQEYETGQKMLADTEMKRAELQNTLLRISGAIQVLEEMLANNEPSPVAENGN